MVALTVFTYVGLIMLISLLFYRKLWKAMDFEFVPQKSKDKQYIFVDEDGEQEHLPMLAETDEELDEEGFW